MKTLEQKLAENILRLNQKSSYAKISKGYFSKAPNIEGYLFNFRTSDVKVYLILNTSETKYNREYINLKDYFFIVYNVPSLEAFISNLNNNMLGIMTNIKLVFDEASKYLQQIKDGLPFGYYLDNDNNIRIDTQEANMVKKIFQIYPKYLSIRDVANELDTNFSRVHDVLYDDRYGKMKQKIVTEEELKKVKDIIYKNRKNKVDKKRKIGAMVLDKDMKQVNTVDKNKNKEEDKKNGAK